MKRSSQPGRRRFLRLGSTSLGVAVGLPAVSGLSTAQSVRWQHYYGGGFGPSWAADIVRTHDGGYAILGTAAYYDYTGAGYWLVKIDSDGTEDWDRVYTNSNTLVADSGSVASSLVELADGGFAIAGHTEYDYDGDYIGDKSGIWVVTTDANGKLRQSREYSYSEAHTTYASDLVEVRDGKTTDGVAILGRARNVETSEAMSWLIRTGADLESIWWETYDHGTALLRPADGGYVILGTEHAGTETADYWLGRLNEDGSYKWTRAYDNDGNRDQAAAIVEDCREGRTRGYAIAGSTAENATANSQSDYWMVTTDDTGERQDSATYSSDASDWPSDIVSTGDGYGILGMTEGDYQLLRVNQNLDLEWIQTYGAAETGAEENKEFEDEEITYTPQSLVYSRDGGYVLLGSEYREVPFEYFDGMTVYENIWSVSVTDRP